MTVVAKKKQEWFACQPVVIAFQPRRLFTFWSDYSNFKFAVPQNSFVIMHVCENLMWRPSWPSVYSPTLFKLLSHWMAEILLNSQIKKQQKCKYIPYQAVQDWAGFLRKSPDHASWYHHLWVPMCFQKWCSWHPMFPQGLIRRYA